MSLQQVSGIAIIVSSIFSFLTMPVAPQAYQEAYIGRRMAILASNGTRWVVSQGFFALGMLGPAAGFSLPTLSLRPLPLGWLIFLGAAAFLIGTIMPIALLVLRGEGSFFILALIDLVTLIAGIVITTQ